MISIVGLLVLLAFVFTLIHAINGKVPLWIAVLFLCIVHLVGVLVR